MFICIIIGMCTHGGASDRSISAAQFMQGCGRKKIAFAAKFRQKELCMWNYSRFHEKFTSHRQRFMSHAITLHRPGNNNSECAFIKYWSISSHAWKLFMIRQDMLPPPFLICAAFYTFCANVINVLLFSLMGSWIFINRWKFPFITEILYSAVHISIWIFEWLE